jgi:polyhydroxyalkanoate synthesis repressor PhaR
MAKTGTPVLIKRYGGGRLYDPAAAAYVTLDDLASMVEDDEDFVVMEAGTGEDVTRSMLNQIIVGRRRHG